MPSSSEKPYIKREMKKLMRSMDFVTDNFLNNDALSWKIQKPYYEIYQQLGLAWGIPVRALRPLGRLQEDKRGQTRVQDLWERAA